MVTSPHLTGTGSKAFLLQGPLYSIGPTQRNTATFPHDACIVRFVILHCLLTGVRVTMVVSFRERLVYFIQLLFWDPLPVLDPLRFPLVPLSPLMATSIKVL